MAKKSSAEPELPTTSEPQAPPASVEDGGETLRFAPPPWAFGDLITAISTERVPALRIPAVLRAVHRHGIALGPAALAHVERVMDDPGHRDTERTPWLHVLSCYPSLRAARLASRLLGSKSARPLVMRVLSTMKPEATAILTAQKAAKGKPAEAARLALEELT